MPNFLLLEPLNPGTLQSSLHNNREKDTNANDTCQEYTDKIYKEYKMI